MNCAKIQGRIFVLDMPISEGRFLFENPMAKKIFSMQEIGQRCRLLGSADLKVNTDRKLYLFPFYVKDSRVGNLVMAKKIK
jgi:hypothetical protein